MTTTNITMIPFRLHSVTHFEYLKEKLTKGNSYTQLTDLGTEYRCIYLKASLWHNGFYV